MPLDGAAKTAVGIVLQILATFLAALAYVLQKQAHLNALRGGAAAGPASGSLLWRVGFALMVSVALVDVYSFSLLDQSTLGAFGAATLAWNVVLAHLVLKEEITRLMLAAVALISAGTVLAVSSSTSSASSFTLAIIVELARLPRVYAWCAVNFLGIAGTAYTLERAAALPPAARSRHHDVLFSILSPITGGMCMGCALFRVQRAACCVFPRAHCSPQITPTSTHPHAHLLLSSRSFTGWGAKAVSTVVIEGEWSEFSRGPLYGFITLVALALTLQVRYLNKGLEHSDAMRVVPVFQAAIVFSNSMGGVIFYGDMVNEGASRQAAFALGALIAICGVGVLLCRAQGLIK